MPERAARRRLSRSNHEATGFGEASPTSLRQGYGGPPKRFARRRKRAVDLPRRRVYLFVFEGFADWERWYDSSG